MIKRFFSPPRFEKEEDNFRAKFINGFAWSAIALLAFAMIPYLTKPAVDFTLAIASGLIALMFASLYLLRRGNVNASGMTIIVLGWLGLGIQAYTADGVRDVAVIAYLAIGMFASIIISWRAGGIVILTSIGAIWALALLEVNGYYMPRFQDPLQFSRDLSLAFIAVAVLVYFSAISMRNTITRANDSEQELLKSNRTLQELNQNLEDRVASRTTELELVNQRNERRAKLFEAVASVARTTTASQNLETLLPSLVQVISEQFGFYHAGIFLLDENREFAVLKAANSAGGKRMVSREHKLKIGQTGIVGYVAASGNPRIALDVEADAAFFNNPDLPGTRSEMALPFRVADEIIGVLDVQSLESNAFQEEDIEVLSTLADQVAIAIQNAGSFETTQRLLREAQKTSGSFLRDSWRVLQSQEQHVGYLISETTFKPLDRALESDLIAKVTSRGKSVVESGEVSNLAVPIRLGGNVVGVVDIRLPEEHEWEQDEVDIAEAVADRLSLALESATFLQATQRRAEIEHLTADVTGKIGATTQFDSILRTAAEELSRVLGGSEVLVQIQPSGSDKEKDEFKS